jgi:uncharacterized membrane protein YGL010W
MRTAEQWLDEYGDSHRNATNKVLHWLCVPLIAWCVIGFLYSLPFPDALHTAAPLLNWGSLAVIAAILYYAWLSIPLALGAAPVLLALLASVVWLDKSRAPLWGIFGAVFVFAWIGQFIGHAIEGKRPSFFKDLQFLMIGPLWLLAAAYKRLQIRF